MQRAAAVRVAQIGVCAGGEQGGDEFGAVGARGGEMQRHRRAAAAEGKPPAALPAGQLRLDVASPDREIGQDARRLPLGGRDMDGAPALLVGERAVGPGAQQLGGDGRLARLCGGEMQRRAPFAIALGDIHLAREAIAHLLRRRGGKERVRRPIRAGQLGMGGL